MAFRAGKRKEVKKQSYYVWFLGAKESEGLRGEEYVRPVLRHLLDREKELEPTKVTLQVSGKGLKIVQNVPRRSNRFKTEQIKHFIPHHAVTCALQEGEPDDDIVCCILLIYNPLTKCPVHVHAYRCDSVETAGALRSQLQALVDRSDNQKKFRDIENRLADKGLLRPRRVNSDGRSTRTDGSDQTEDSPGGSERDGPACGPRDQRVASLYDSLAAELRERLGNPDSCPILLPPKDYDTVSRGRGHLQGIEQRRSTNRDLVGRTPSSVGPLLTKSLLPKSSGRLANSGSSGKSSSGIGSDEALSSAAQHTPPCFQSKAVDVCASSEDEALPEEGRVVRKVQRKSSPPCVDERGHRPSIPSSSSPKGPSPPTYLYGQREPILLRDRSQESSPKRDLCNNLSASVKESKDVDHIRERAHEVVYRWKHNSADNQVPRTCRPVSYPYHHAQEHCRSSSSLGPQPGEIPSRDRDPEKPPSSDSREKDLCRRNASPRSHAGKGLSECYLPPAERSRHSPNDWRSSGCFDLPVDYRHSFAEPGSRVLPVGVRY